MKTEIIYEDDALLIVYKPAGLATQSAKITQPDVVHELQNYLAERKKTPYIGIVHRLDQPVEGLLVFGKTKQATTDLSKQLSAAGEQKADKTCQKNYLAVVSLEKEISPDRPKKVCLIDYLLKDGQKNLAKVVKKEIKQAKQAVLTYSVQNQTDEIACLKITLQTGRFHQIRAQMANAGMPLLGDFKYGTEISKKRSQFFNVRTVALCADELIFLHPVTREKIVQKIIPRNPAFTYCISSG